MVLGSVLVVDGDRQALASTLAVLAGAGYAATGAASGPRAMEQIAISPPNVLIADILPDGNGVELIAAAKQAHRDTRVIATTECLYLRRLHLVDLAKELGA